MSGAATSIRNMSAALLLQRAKRLRRELGAKPGSPIRISVLGGVTTSEVVTLLELLLLSEGCSPEFQESEYNRYYEDAVLEPEKIAAFRPDVVLVHTHWNNIRLFPEPGCSRRDFMDSLAAEFSRFQAIWNSIRNAVGCQIIQNNFEQPPFRTLAGLDSVSWGGRSRFVAELNREFAEAAASRTWPVIHDLNAVAAGFGLSHWYDWQRWFSYKIPTTPEASLATAKSLASVVGAMFGRAKKCLVLDLDNTLWGGVIGDDGADRIQIGRETAVAEAHTAFQQYCAALRRRGILLAVCSKNDPEVAKSGFAHPDTVLTLADFAAFRANWEPKHENIASIAQELNLGLDSFVFVDDNPAERAIVSAQLPMVEVPDVGSDPAFYPSILEAHNYFQTLNLSAEDLQRAEAYSANAVRAAAGAHFADYGEYLDSLEMTAEISSFRPVYLERIAQLINKSNQFNLTTRRYTLAEVEATAADVRQVAFYGRLADKFGDNGLVSVIIGHTDGPLLHLDLWIMSCRVLKRDMELAMLDSLVLRAKSRGIREIVGYYFRTAKNGMVENHYGGLGFTLASRAEDGASSVWNLAVADYSPRNRHIRVEMSDSVPATA
jgi:FkbH-like protein